MKQVNIVERLAFLAKSFDVFESVDGEIELKINELKKAGYKSKLIKSSDSNILAIYSVTINKKERTLKRISVSSEVFSSMIEADPTENKMYLQWMLNLFVRLLKDKDKESVSSAIRFVSEDLPQANVYLTLFDENKRKKLFLDLCTKSYGLKHVADPTNINQYKSLSQLFNAVDPFITKEPSAVERQLAKFEEAGQAIIPMIDRNFTLYIPKSTAASVVFDNYANWCTAKVGNGMFDSYTRTNKKPNGKNSDIYIIVNNKFFTGESDEIFQIHFETGQIKDKNNSSNVSIFESVLSKSEGLSNFFYEELMGMAKEDKKGIDNNKYLDYLIQFGFSESLFEFLDLNTPTIKFMKREIPKLPDLGRFKDLDQLIICEAKLSELHPSVGKLTKLDMLVLSQNNLKTLPREIGSLKNLTFMNLIGNKIESFPEEMAYLDKSKGGSLFKIGVKKEEIGEENYRNLKKLLPSVQF